MFGSEVRGADQMAWAGGQFDDTAFGPFAGRDAHVSDRDIRLALAAGRAPRLLRGGAAMEEVRCWRGHVRADYLVVSAQQLAVIEIKSDADTMRRLGEQIRVYSAFADRAALVVGWSLAAEALRSIPYWWEVWLAEKPPASETRLILLRDGAPNPDVTPLGLASMLPVRDARKIAIDVGVPVRDSRGKELRRALAERLTIDDLRAAVTQWLNRLSVQRASQQA